MIITIITIIIVIIIIIVLQSWRGGVDDSDVRQVVAWVTFSTKQENFKLRQASFDSYRVSMLFFGALRLLHWAPPGIINRGKETNGHGKHTPFNPFSNHKLYSTSFSIQII